ncbi:ptn1, partial [Symbiodinium microadriaticum]
AIAQGMHAEKDATKALEFFHCPTPDTTVTSTESVLRGLQTIVSKLQEGSVVYVHCWGGHGRTGTMVCAFLTAFYGLSVKQAQDFYNAGERRRRARNGYWPASQPQYDQAEAIAGMAVQEILEQRPLLDPLVDWDTRRPQAAPDTGGDWCGCSSIAVAR